MCVCCVNPVIFNSCSFEPLFLVEALRGLLCRWMLVLLCKALSVLRYLRAHHVSQGPFYHLRAIGSRNLPRKIKNKK
jgi:hypothetical protein